MVSCRNKDRKQELSWYQTPDHMDGPVVGCHPVCGNSLTLNKSVYRGFDLQSLPEREATAWHILDSVLD